MKLYFVYYLSNNNKLILNNNNSCVILKIGITKCIGSGMGREKEVKDEKTDFTDTAGK